MAKQRVINTRFWGDGFVLSLKTAEKLLFLYYLTNDHTNICGIYELSMAHISLETGIKQDRILEINKVFFPRIVYVDGWLGVKNFSKYQNGENTNVQKGIKQALKEIPKEILDKIQGLYRGTIAPTIVTQDPVHLNLDLDLDPNLDLDLDSIAVPKVKPQDVVNYFFELKGWANQDKSFYAKQKIVYARYLRPAKDLLTLCDNNLESAKECLRKVGEWAKSRELDWAIETVFKKWYEIDFLKPKEKKPYFDGCRVFQKSAGGRWYIVRNGEIKELGINLKQEQLAWK